MVYENNINVSPGSYSPSVKFVKKKSGIYSIRPQYELAELIYIQNEKRPTPSHYKIDEKHVKPARFSKIHAGGYGLKDGLIISKNPGPGHYRTTSSIVEDSFKKGEMSKSFH